jgi:hypothetical protein
MRRQKTHPSGRSICESAFYSDARSPLQGVMVSTVIR